MGFAGGAGGKEPACQSAGDRRDAGLIPGLGRSPEEGNGSPLQYSWLENPMDGGAWWATVHGSQRVKYLKRRKEWMGAEMKHDWPCVDNC